MQRLHFSANAAPLQPSIVNVTSSSANAVTPEILDAVFRSVNIVGIDEIYNLCEQRREGRLSDSTIQQMDFGEYQNINWLLPLSHASLIDVQNSVAGVRNNISYVLGALKKSGDWSRGHQEVFLYSSNFNQTSSFQITANAGSIYRKDAQGNEVLLMTFAQFLTNAKPSWRTVWNLAGLNLSDLDLSGVNLDYANLEDTNLSYANLSDASMIGANLKNAGLANANVSRANFSRANLSEAYLEDTDLSEIKIDDAFVLEPKLTNASIRPTILDALFHSVSKIGAEHVIRLCQNKLDNHPNWFDDRTVRECQDHIYQLATLNNHELRVVQQIALGLQKNVPDIAGAFHVNANRQKQIVVYPAYPSETDEFQIIAKAGCLYLRNKDQTGLGILVMSLGQFFNKGLAPGENKIWNLAGMDLSNLDLSGAFLNKANLSGANLCRTNLTGTRMQEANLSSANLKEATLCDTQLDKANLHKADMRWSVTSGANLSEANLSEANLFGSEMEYTDFRKANLHDTNFTDATMHKVFLLGVKIDRTTTLQGTSITLNSADMENWDQALNHLANPESGSLLTMFNNIDEQYLNKEGKVLKLDLMHQIIENIKEEIKEEAELMVHVEPLMNIFVVEPLMDIFANNPLYRNDPLIRTFMKETVLPARITQANKSELKVDGAPELRLLLEVVQSEEQPAQFMLDNNNFFVQLMRECTEKNSPPDIQQSAQQLFLQYLNLPQLKGVEELIDDVTGGDIRLIDGLEKHITTGAELPAGACFPFFKRLENTHHVLILDRIQFRAMQRSDSSDAECRYDALCYAKGQPQLALIPPGEQSLPDIVRVFSLFENPYQFKVNSATFIRLLSTINLKYDNTNHDPNYLSKDYTPLFVQALNSPQSTTKLCGIQDQLTLNALFSPVLVAHPLGMQTYLASVNITDDHYADLVAVYGLSTATNLTKAQTLFCLAAVFAKYSSSYIFGKETESPEALRAYAVALLVKAYELDPSVFADDQHTAAENFRDLVQKMLGGKDNVGRAFFTCSAVVSQTMLSHAQQDESFNAISVKTKPSSW